MKVIIAYPPLNTQKGCPTLGQNRQFQYFKAPTYIYPVVPAQAATLLKQAGHEVIWLDAIAQGLSYQKFMEIIRQENPDLIAFETKTPVIKQHWKIINDIKDLSPSDTKGLIPSDIKGLIPSDTKGLIPSDTKGLSPSSILSSHPKGTVPKIALFGDHVTALPEESFQHSQVDFVLSGGDYDFLLLNLCNALKGLSSSDTKGLSPSDTKGLSPSDTLSSRSKGTVPEYISQLEPGVYYRANGQIKNTGPFQLNHDLSALPFIDRDLTKWQLYAEKNGNYKRTPGMYIMAGRDCWWGKCSFCSWTTIYPSFRVRSVNNVLNEIGMLIDKYKIREIMDDTGCFPVGDWLKDFCKGIIERGLSRKIYLDCNMRFGALSDEDFTLMKRANFRLLLFGLESANQTTLDRINKKLKAERIIEDCKLATKAGLFPHITIMFGYPWESYEDALRTLALGKWLLKKGYAYTMQATIVIPYPGTPLFDECKQKGWLKSMAWEDYDMKQPIMKATIPDEKIMELVQGMYKVSLSPEFILRKIFSLKDIDDTRYSLRAAKKVFGHIFDFNKGTNKGTVPKNFA